MYSRWATIEEIKAKLNKISSLKEVECSGVPMMYDDDSMYIKDNTTHTLVIGATGSGKTQVTVLPKIKLAIQAGESMLVHDMKGEIYNQFANELKDSDYNTLIINLSDPTKGDSFNIFTLPYRLYRDGKKDLAIDILNNIAYYFLSEDKFNDNTDPFWINSACSLFLGLALYLFENEKDEKNITLNKIFELSTELDKVKDAINNLDKSSAIYISLAPVLLAPSETKGSIASVFGQKLRQFVSKEELSHMLNEKELDIDSIINHKTAIFIISDDRTATKRLVPLIVDEIYNLLKINNNIKKFNIILDEFGAFIPIKDFSGILSLSRGYNIEILAFVTSFFDLTNRYGKEATEIIKISFGNILYLMANDIETLEEVSKLCGNKKENDKFIPLISPEELKLLDPFEAVILIPRLNPIRTKLVPYYKIDWK